MSSESKDQSCERPRRRSYDPAFKRALVAKTLEPGASVARIAREHGINANQLFTWRRRQLLAERNASSDQREGEPPPALLPVTVLTAPTPDAAPTLAVAQGEIEIRLGRAQIRIRGAADAATLQLVLANLRR